MTQTLAIRLRGGRSSRGWESLAHEGHNHKVMMATMEKDKTLKATTIEVGAAPK
jgi:hypothetical protein